MKSTSKKTGKSRTVRILEKANQRVINANMNLLDIQNAIYGAETSQKLTDRIKPEFYVMAFLLIVGLIFFFINWKVGYIIVIALMAYKIFGYFVTFLKLTWKKIRGKKNENNEKI